MRVEPWVLALGLGAAAFGFGCRAPFEASAPAGFAAFEGADPFRAVSPDGVLYRVRAEPAGAEGGDLAFWSETLRRHLESSGYQVQSEGPLDGGPVDGHLIRSTAPRGPEDWRYLVALFVRGDQVVIVEAAGEVTRLDAHEDEILAAIRSIRLD